MQWASLLLPQCVKLGQDILFSKINITHSTLYICLLFDGLKQCFSTGGSHSVLSKKQTNKKNVILKASFTDMALIKQGLCLH